MSRPPKNMAISVGNWLTARARERRENAQLLMTRYVIERLLFRLSQSPEAQCYGRASPASDKSPRIEEHNHLTSRRGVRHKIGRVLDLKVMPEHADR